MKKRLLLWVLLLAAPCAFAATPDFSLERALYQAAASGPIYSFSAEKQAEFNALLPKAIANMKAMKNTSMPLDPRFLGCALVKRMDSWWHVDCDRSEETTPQEKRAEHYAVWTLLPAQYNQGVMPFKEYSKLYPVENWDHFRQDCQTTFNYVFDAISEIANDDINNPYTAESWLFFLNNGACN